ncbi:MAG: GNAT family N-acetyltransferase [Myxococcota bacterium]
MSSQIIKKYKEFVFRYASIEDIRNIIELFERNYKKPMGLTESYNHFNWEYIENPVKKLYILLAVGENGDIAAQYALLPKCIRVFGETTVCTLSQDTITDEKYRGRGLFVALADTLYDLVKGNNILFTYGFPNKNSAPGFFNRLGWNELKPIPIYFKPIFIKGYDYSSLPFFGRNSFLRTIFKIATYTYNMMLKRKMVDNGIEVREISDFMPIFDEIWNMVNYNDKVIVVRDNKYIKWRFFDKPENNYKKFVFYKDSKASGYLITSVIKKFGIDMLFVVDFVVTSEELTKYVIAYIDNIAMASSTPLISIILPPIYRKLFTLSGYFRLPERLFPQELHFGFRVHRSFNGDEKLKDVNNWYMTWGDSDVV